MTSWPIVMGTVGVNTVELFPPLAGGYSDGTIELENRTRVRASYTFSKLYIYVQSNGSGGFTLRTRKNSANGGQSVAVGASATGAFEDTSGSDSLVDGDYINYQTTIIASASVTIGLVSVICESATDKPFYITGQVTLSAGITYYLSFFGQNWLSPTTVEADRQVTVRETITFSNLRTYVGSNSTSAGATLITRKNGANGNQSVSIGAAATGEFEDTTNTDSITSGDTFNYQCVVAAGTGSLFHTLTQITSTGTKRVLGTGYIDSTLTVGNGLRTWLIEDNLNTITTIEANRQAKARQAGTLRDYEARLTTNSYNLTATIGLRVNAVHSTLIVSVAPAATGIFTNLSDAVNVAATDLINNAVSGPTSGSMILRYTMMEFGPSEAPATVLQDLVGMGVIPFDR